MIELTELKGKLQAAEYEIERWRACYGEDALRHAVNVMTRLQRAEERLDVLQAAITEILAPARESIPRQEIEVLTEVFSSS